ncbi:C4-type zinc ribbon domain-containing protein [Ornithinimicrobium sp. F0845]|uniref:zinc ribbon domain-containing protein n=1 Tax=Ornithinimicrobium sp. F0845 TaxID=2926412 RepID=UPI001FF1C8C3|nr:C4-type zinc ribbon domain-containing protein [Ornithinimicrobium sp. F0845]
MKADPTQQQRLLDLQALDTRLGQLDHQLRGLPEHAELETLTARAADLDAEVVRTTTARGDVQRELAKAEQDVQLVRDRAARDQQRLDAGLGSAKDLQAIQHELESLARRQTTLEDEELEVMERAEALDAEVAKAEADRDALAAQIAEVTASRDTKAQALQADRAEVAAGRDAIVADISDELVALYDKIRAQSGTGAAPLQQRRCGGCQLELNQVDLGRIRSAEADEVLRCEECRRILVRTAESGL